MIFYYNKTFILKILIILKKIKINNCINFFKFLKILFHLIFNYKIKK